MALSYTGVDSEDLGFGLILQTKVKEVTGRGCIVRVELLQKERKDGKTRYYVVGEGVCWAQPDVVLTDFSGMSWTTLVIEDIGQGNKRLTRAYEIASTGAMVLLMNQVGYVGGDGKKKTTYTITGMFYACGIEINGTSDDLINDGLVNCTGAPS